MGPDQGRLGARVRVAYVMSRFPKVTETFVLFEMLALEELGFEVEVFPLLREHERVVHAEARVLVERAHYCSLFSWRVLAAQLHWLARRPVAYLGTLAAVLARTLPSPNYLAGALAFFPKSALFAREMRAAGVQHVHAHFANHPALAALIAHRLAGIPFSFTAHGSDLHVDQTALAWKIAGSAFAVTVSEYNREFVRERAGAAAAEKVRVIHCGADARIAVRAGEAASDAFEILCVAALREVKGHRHLLDACVLLRDAGLRFRCDLVGSGELEREIRARIEAAGLGAHVRLLGPLSHDDVLARMRAAHALVLPSVLDRDGRREGIPVTLMEAMACGLPVVTSRISGIPELVEDGRSGLLAPPGDARALADALRRLADSPALRAELGRGARQQVERDFDLRAGARRLGEEILRARAART